MSFSMSIVSSGLFLVGCIIELGTAVNKRYIAKSDIYRKSQDSMKHTTNLHKPPKRKPQTTAQI